MTATNQYDNRDSVNSSLRGAGSFNSTYLTTEIKNLKPTEILDLSDIDKIIRDGFTEDFARGFVGIEAAPRVEAYFMLADIINGKILVNFAVDENGFDAGTSLVNAFEKLKNKQPLTKNEEYSIEVLWHEILHMKSKNTVILPPIKAVDVGINRVVLETVNQLVARKTYPDFLERLGGKAQHSEWILNNGYGYKNCVKNIRRLLEKLDINESKFITGAEDLLMGDYTDFHPKIERLILEMGETKNEWYAKMSLGHIDGNLFDYYLSFL